MNKVKTQKCIYKSGRCYNLNLNLPPFLHFFLSSGLGSGSGLGLGLELVMVGPNMVCVLPEPVWVRVRV